MTVIDIRSKTHPLFRIYYRPTTPATTVCVYSENQPLTAIKTQVNLP